MSGKKTKATRPVISLFSGAMGLDLGLERAGLEIAVAVECNPYAVATIKANEAALAGTRIPFDQSWFELK